MTFGSLKSTPTFSQPPSGAHNLPVHGPNTLPPWRGLGGDNSIMQNLPASGSNTAPPWQGLGGNSFGGNNKNGPVDVHEALYQVRQSPRFHPPSKSPLEEINPSLYHQLQHLASQIQEMIQYLFQQVRQFLQSLLPGQMSGETSHAISLALEYALILFSLLMAAVLFYLFLSFIKRLMARTDRNRKKTNSSDLTGFFTTPNSTEYLQRAGASASRAEYNQAVRFTYLALLALLAERRLILATPSRTNAEYLQDLKPHTAGIIQPFQNIAFLFERMKYGRQDTFSGDYNKALSTYQIIENATAYSQQTRKDVRQ